jgi:hypothetical protein
VAVQNVDRDKRRQHQAEQREKVWSVDQPLT